MWSGLSGQKLLQGVHGSLALPRESLRHTGQPPKPTRQTTHKDPCFVAVQFRKQMTLLTSRQV
jgi:hypothetical protein